MHHTATKTNKPFTIDHYHNRIINGIPKLENNPTKCTSDIKQNFLPLEIRSSVTEFLDSYSDYSEKGSRKVAIFGQPPSTYGTREHKKIASIPPTLNAVINLVHEHFNISEDNKINSVVICKYKSNSSHLPKQSDIDVTLAPESQIYTLSFGDSCDVVFSDKCSANTTTVKVADNTVYSMSTKSQHYWAHEIPSPVSSDQSVHYTITLRSVDKKYRNSTIIIGDSNTHHLYFHHERRNNDLGKEIAGKRVKAYTTEQINPSDAIGYRNIVIQVGINNLKQKYANELGVVDIESAFNQWLVKIIEIKQLCPYSRIIISPILPTKIRALNLRAEEFNIMMMSCRNIFWSHLNFSSFLGPDGLLENNFGRFFRINTGKRDRIHLGRLGIARLALLIREAVLYPGKVTGNRSYSSIVRSQAELLPTVSKT